jgi:hypothetical protein
MVLGLGGSRGIRFLMGVLFSAVGLPGSFIFAGGIPSDLAILVTGRPAEGRVVSSELDTSMKINGHHPTVIRFDYTVAGKRYQAESSAVGGPAVALARGDAVSVEVASVRSSWARIAGTTRSWTGYLGSFVLLFPAIGIVMLVGFVREHRRAIRAFVHGYPATAKIVFAGQDEHHSANDRHPYKLVWEFRAGDGNVYRGTLTSMNKMDLEPFAKDGEVTVLYVLDDPRSNTLFVP